MKSKIIAFMNAYSHGKSGGDMVFIEIAKRLTTYKKIIVTSQLGKTICQQSGVDASFLVTSDESVFAHVIWMYLKRTIKAFFLPLDLTEGDVLLGTSDFLPDVLPIWWFRITHKNLRWVQHVFHLIPSSRKIPFWAQYVSLFFIRHFADIVVVDNHLLKSELQQRGFDAKKIVVNYPGIDLEYFKSIKKSPPGYDGVFIGQLRVSKGIFDLIGIWGHICKKEPNARLGIIGKGSEEIIQELRMKIAESHLDQNIALLGFMESSEAFALIKTSTVLVFPSHEEGFGIAALEAQALGLPVVAWNLPLFKEIFPNGMIQLEEGNLKRFAKKVLELLHNKKTREKLSREALANAGRFEWDTTFKRELQLIQDIHENIFSQTP